MWSSEAAINWGSFHTRDGPNFLVSAMSDPLLSSRLSHLWWPKQLDILAWYQLSLWLRESFTFGDLRFLVSWFPSQCQVSLRLCNFATYGGLSLPISFWNVSSVFDLAIRDLGISAQQRQLDFWPRYSAYFGDLDFLVSFCNSSSAFRFAIEPLSAAYTSAFLRNVTYGGLIFPV